MSDAIYDWLDKRRSAAWQAHFAAKDAYAAVMDDESVPRALKQELAGEFDRTRMVAYTLNALATERCHEPGDEQARIVGDLLGMTLTREP